MMHKLLVVVTVAWPLLDVAAELERAERPFRVGAVEAVKLVESGAILAEDFDGPRLDLSRWRVWQPWRQVPCGSLAYPGFLNVA
jgi:hypothetical protein